MNSTNDVRTRILDAAERCFYGRGITATGVDTLADEAGVSKRTLYNHFVSKEGVVTAYLQRREDRWRKRLADRLASAGTPTDRLTSFIQAYCESPRPDGYRGCPMINAAAELDDAHPAMEVIRDSLANVEERLTEILTEVGVDDAAARAAQALVVLEGAMSVSGIRRTASAADTAEGLVMALVDHRFSESALT